MARRGRYGPQDDYDDRGAYPRSRRRKSGSEGVLIALSIAGVVAIVLFFVISSGSSGEEDLGEAKTFLRDLFQTFVNNDENAGKDMVDPRQILAPIKKAQVKEWHSFSDARKEEFAREAWRLIRINVITEMKGDPTKPLTMQDCDQILGLMKGKWVASRSEAEFSWDYLGKPWRARIVRQDIGKWIVIDLRQGL